MAEVVKWTLVTGGARRIGAAICLHLAEKGYNVLIHYKNSQEEADKVARACAALGVYAACIRGDFSNTDHLHTFIQEVEMKYPSIENLVNNVGNYLIKSALNTSEEEWKSIFQTNLFTPLLLMQKLIPQIKSNKGSIINLGTSGLSASRADTYSTAYKMTKSALLTLTRSLARELAPEHVRVNMVSPGQMDISRDAPADLSKLPMGRLGTSQEIARVVAFLLDPENSYITGQNIEVAGGLGL